MEEQDKEFDLKFIKNNWNWILLAVILCFGFYLRVYHLDYPVIGYHNLKEVHYLTEAKNFARDGFFKYGFFVPAWDYPKIKEDPSGIHSDTFPTTSIIVGIFFKMFGFKLWIARLISIFFSLSSVVFFYLIIKNLFKREDLALISAALMSINPLLVFFGRQVQLINPALFFCLMGSYFYFKWIDGFLWKNLLLFAIPMFLGILTKYTFVLFIVPLLFLFPFNELKDKKKWSQYLSVIIIAILSASWVLYISTASKNIEGQLSQLNLTNFFSGSFWKTVYYYAVDNYTVLGVILAFLGVILFLILSKGKKSKDFKYIKYYLLSSIVWFVIFTGKLKGHNYHQYPIMPLVVFFISYFFVFISVNVSKLLKLNHLKWVLPILLIIILWVPSVTSKNRMFDTYFVGLDVAGDYIKSNSKPGERLLHSAHQSFGINWHADMKGERLTNFTELKYAEENLNVSWLFVYQWGIPKYVNDKELWQYIQQTYSLKQFAFVKSNDQIQPVYFLFYKEGSFDESQLNEYLQGRAMKTKKYETTKGLRTLNYIDI
jgi:4-amino-4-deoxy-L-arabinose transferase-like glycosyltransferase